MEEILVTGGMGFIGSHTCVALIEAGYLPVIVDDLSNSRIEVLDGIAAITGLRPAFYEADVADDAALCAVFTAHKIRAAIHFAGLKAVGESKEKPLEYYCNNLNSTMNLLKSMDRFGVSHLVFSSSATVYNAEQHVLLSEETPRHCVSPYGWSKFMSEQIIADHMATRPERSAVLLRYFNPVGAHQSGLIGEAPNGVPQNLMPFVCQVAVGVRETLSVFGGDYDTPDGSAVRDYIHVMDLAHGHVAALAYAEAHSGCEAVNLGTGRGVSVLELIQGFQEVNGVEIPYEITARRPGDAPMYYADTRKAKAVLGWQARRSLDDMCCSAYHWERKSRGLIE